MLDTSLKYTSHTWLHTKQSPGVALGVGRRLEYKQNTKRNKIPKYRSNPIIQIKSLVLYCIEHSSVLWDWVWGGVLSTGKEKNNTKYKVHPFGGIRFGRRVEYDSVKFIVLGTVLYCGIGCGEAS